MTRARSGHRVLVVANETVASDVLRDVVDVRAGEGEGADVLVVAPALTGRLAYWSSAHDAARRAAEERLVVCLASLRSCGIEAEGYVGDADPLLAIDDAMRLFRADEIVVATHPEGRSNWLARDVVGRARRRHSVPIRHVVVDLTEQRQLLAV
jgi:hypothetical protein